jgi:translation initiation factor 1A
MENEPEKFGDKEKSNFSSPQTSEKFGDFEEIIEEGKAAVGGEAQIEVARARIPKKNEIIGMITQRFGGNRMEVHCTDGKKRNCRVPGRFKKFLWLRPRDIILITPWPDDDSKGDIIFKYNPSAANQLRKRGMLKGLEEGF